MILGMITLQNKENFLLKTWLEDKNEENYRS